MKHLYLFAALLLTVVSGSYGQFQAQYFDSSDPGNYYNQLQVVIPTDTLTPNTWQKGRPQKAIFDSAATYPNAIVTDTLNFYPVNDSSYFIVKVPALTSWGVLAIQWTQKLDLDSAADYGAVEVSFDTGQTWISVFDNPHVYNFYGYLPGNIAVLPGGGFAFSGTDTVWRDVWLCYDMYWLNLHNIDTVQVRYKLLTDSVDNQKEGWLIDNFNAHITMIHTISEVKSQQYITVYPNPANDVLHIETEKLPVPHIIEQMQLINALGQVVDEWQNEPTKFFIPTAKYPPGVYMLKIKTNLKTETIKFAIAHNG